MTARRYLSLPFILVALAGCADPYVHTPNPDYAIRVVKTEQGFVAEPPSCPNWAKTPTDPFDNQPVPQFGCSTARNLALSVENAEDLTHGRFLDAQRGVKAVGAIRRYDNDQTRGLIDPQSSTDSSLAITTASTPSSGLTGDATGSASTGSSSIPGTTTTTAPTGAPGP